MRRPSTTAILGAASALLLMGGGAWVAFDLVSADDQKPQRTTTTTEDEPSELDEQITPSERPGETDSDEPSTRTTSNDETSQDGATEDDDITAEEATASLKGVTVAIDPGHNGGNKGAARRINRLVDAGGLRKACDTTGTRAKTGLTESMFAIDVAFRMKELLERDGAKVVLTRENDEGVGPCIDRRAKITNTADIAISVHADGNDKAGARGFHIIATHARHARSAEQAADSLSLARELVPVLANTDGLVISNYAGKAGIDIRDDIGGLNLATNPKVLVELGNMRDERDMVVLGTKVGRHTLAQSLVDGLALWLAKRDAATTDQ
jgi:N-acetylmuramoyl-L-alanine amidase